jgi:endoglucanase
MIRVLVCLALVSFAQGLYVRVNQLGFAPVDVKTALVFGSEPLPPDFRIIDAGSGKVVFAGKVITAPGSWGQFQQHGELNFSALARTGRFIIEAGSARSLPFNVSPNSYTDLPDHLLEFMRQQRCGYNPFVDAVCHSFDGRTAFGPEPAGRTLTHPADGTTRAIN